MLKILVHEPDSHWVAELERQFLDRPEITFRWRPYQEELMEELSTARLVVLVIPADNESLDLVRQLRSRNDPPGIVCLVPSSNAGWEWLARELGVDVVFIEPVEQWRVGHSITRLLTELQSVPGI